MSRLHWFYAHVEEVLGVILLVLMSLLAFANVITRYLFEYPLAFTEELEVNALVWMTVLGTAAAFRKRHHLSMLYFQAKMSPKVRVLIQIMVVFLSAGLFISLGWLGYLQLQDEILLEITSESLALPQWWYTLSIPVGCILIVYRIFEAGILNIKEKLSGSC